MFNIFSLARLLFGSTFGVAMCMRLCVCVCVRARIFLYSCTAALIGKIQFSPLNDILIDSTSKWNELKQSFQNIHTKYGAVSFHRRDFQTTVFLSNRWFIKLIVDFFFGYFTKWASIRKCSFKIFSMFFFPSLSLCRVCFSCWSNVKNILLQHLFFNAMNHHLKDYHCKLKKK